MRGVCANVLAGTWMSNIWKFEATGNFVESAGTYLVGLVEEFVFLIVGWDEKLSKEIIGYTLYL